MKKKLLVTLLAASFAFTMLAGCGKSESAEGQARGETGSAAQDKTEEADRSEHGSTQKTEQEAVRLTVRRAAKAAGRTVQKVMRMRKPPADRTKMQTRTAQQREKQVM